MKYFTELEVKGLKAILIQRLEAMREALGQPIRLTETVAFGGSHVEDTAHGKGEAVDASIRSVADLTDFTVKEKLKIAWAAGKAGINRLGVYNRHFHVDVAVDKPSPAIWTGVSH